MKILQLNNTACVPLTIARAMRKRGHEVDVLAPIFTVIDAQYLAGLSDIIRIKPYSQVIMDWLGDNVIEYDVVHVHAKPEYIAWINAMSPDTKIVYTGHGTDVRLGWHRITKNADYRTCISLDLLTEDVDWIPNIPDPDVWTRQCSVIPKTALWKKFDRNIFDEVRIEKEVKEIARTNGLSLRFQDRSQFILPYVVYPRYLEKFEVYFDCKYLNPQMYAMTDLPFASYTALQFLQLGNNRVFHNGTEYTELPATFNYDKIMHKWEKIYEELL